MNYGLWVNAKINTSISVAGYANHTPVIPNKYDRMNAIGMRIRKLRIIEITCAGIG